ncbi:GTPase HflX [Phocicoccus pinnipedialis]|uniref:GTPase HflX n=1 Tax=Phocicoccus pinnipedialis TaxID=110845 RepID=A0A6V7RFE4_9BACL|nr:GTPase HflX [Jeotgalicoccus pinnipedialis]MBP1939149.1 GTP-binding protein HflX [Jeotgalicoccus pinnipedialis]CAD2076577.1 GTPase HflX [Jeotgalicoccus pinnipedialis]
MIFKYKGVIVAVNTPETYNIETEVNELKELAESIDIEIVGMHVQNRSRQDRKYYAGSGFLNEVREMYEEIDYVIVNDEILASQNRNIEALFDASVVDRTQVILDIFSQRAKSREGKLQVELAQLNYLVPRLRGQGINLSRLGAGIGTRGPGETKLETDRRHIGERIKEVKHQLKTIEKHRESYREDRNKTLVTKFSLIGYTNAGKSALFNTLTEADELQEDKLFATLDPKTKRLEFNTGFQVLLTDTVGFIQKLPTMLVESFKSTLEEAADSDFLIHVIDNSNPDIMSQYRTVKELIHELGMEDIPQLVCFNKSDLNSEIRFIPEERYTFTNYNMNKEAIKSELLSLIEAHYIPFKRHLTMADTNELYTLKRDTYVKNEVFNEDSLEYDIEGYTKHMSIVKRTLKE